MRTLALSASVLLAAAFPVGAQTPPVIDVARAVGFGQADGAPVAAGRDYKLLLRSGGQSFVPALGDRAPHDLPLDIVFAGASRGSVRLDTGAPAEPDVQAAARQVRWTRGPGLAEILDVAPEGVELSWELAAPPAGTGDLVVELELRTELPLLQQDESGVLFADAALGGVRVGRVQGRDAAGRVLQGALQCTPAPGGARLRLSLPEAFVRSAQYPLVLDPPVTPYVTALTGAGGPRHSPVACLPAKAWGLCLWVSDFSATDHDLLGRVVEYPPLPMTTSLLLLETSSTWDDMPEASSFAGNDWVLAAWVQKSGAQQRVRGLLLAPHDNSALDVIGTSTDLSGLDASLARPGVNADIVFSGIPGSNIGYVVYGSTTGQVRSVRVDGDNLGAGGQLIVGATTTLVSSVPDAQPTIAPSWDQAAPTLVVWRQAAAVYGLMMDVNGGVVAGPALLKPNGFTPVGQPRVDGAAGHFALVTTEDHPTTELRVTLTSVDGALNHSSHYVMSDHALLPGDVAVSQNSANPAAPLLIGAISTAPGPLNQAVETDAMSLPTLGFIIGGGIWGQGTGLPVDSASICAEFARLVVAWVDAGNNVQFQFGTPWGKGGNIVPIGPSCGGGGALSASSESAIGNFLFALDDLGASPVATTAFLNLGLPGPADTCGPCAVKPVTLLLTMGLVQPGWFHIDLPVPGDPTLAGLVIETQAIVKTPGAGGCSGLKNWSFSNRLSVEFDF
jgi:hypothetical protein